jgi:hypothetical protein
VQYKYNLSDATWSECPQTVIPATTAGIFTDDAPSASGQRYYQVIEAQEQGTALAHASGVARAECPLCDTAGRPLRLGFLAEERFCL